MQARFANLWSMVKNKIWINKWLNLGFLYFFNTVYFGQIQYFFKVLKSVFTIQYFFNAFNTACEPCTRKSMQASNNMKNTYLNVAEIYSFVSQQEYALLKPWFSAYLWDLTFASNLHCSLLIAVVVQFTLFISANTSDSNRFILKPENTHFLLRIFASLQT